MSCNDPILAVWCNDYNVPHARISSEGYTEVLSTHISLVVFPRSLIGDETCSTKHNRFKIANATHVMESMA